MNISAGLKTYTASIQSAMQTAILQKTLHQDAQGMADLLQGMKASIAQTTGVGQNFDMKG